MRGQPPPDGLNGAELGEYWGLFYLYRLYYGGALSREEASKHKRRLLADFQRVRDGMAAREKLLAHTVALWRSIGRYTAACRKNPTQENALALCDAIHGFLREE